MGYGYSIPNGSRQVWEKQILKTQKALQDTLIARTVLEMRELPSTVDIDTVTFVEGSGGTGTSNIQAKIVAKGAVPDVTDVKISETDFKQYQIAIGFYMHERELDQDPLLKNRKIDWATRSIHRLEDYIFFSGDSSIGILGLQAQARANPNGKIVASGASGNDANNVGAWDGTDTYIDIQRDVLNAISRLGDDYDPKFLIGRRADLMHIRQLDEQRKSYADEILDLFGASSIDQVLKYSAFCPSGYVYVTAKNAMAAEFTYSQDIKIVDDMIREKGGNYWVELNEWVNPFQCYDPEAFVEIAIT